MKFSPFELLSSVFSFIQVEPDAAIAADSNSVEALKQQLKEVKQSEAKFRRLVESSCDWLWEVDSDGNYTYLSPQIEDILGYTLEELLGKSVFSLMPAAEAERVGKIFKELADNGQPIVALENINLHKDGHEILFKTDGMPSFDDSGKLIGYYGIDSDITEQRKASERYRNIFTDSKDAMFISNIEKGMLDSNPAALKMFGIATVEDFVDIHPSVISPEYQPCGMSSFDKANAMMTKAYEEGSNYFEWTHQRADGTTFPATVLITKLTLDDRAMFLATVRDITERKKNEAELLDYRNNLEDMVQKRTEELHQANSQLELFKRAIDSANQGIGWADIKTQELVYCNLALAKMFNASCPEDVIGKSVLDFYPLSERKRLSDDIFPQVTSGYSWKGELIIQPSGQEKLYTYNHIVAIKDSENQQLLYFANMVTDLTEQKAAAAKLEQTQKQLVDTARLAGKAEVATSVLHNVGNVLNSVTVTTSQLKKSVKDFKTSNLAQVAKLLAEHREDIGDYIGSDDKGKQLPDYIIALSEYFVSEQAAAVEMLDKLVNHIQHVTEIISLQQSHGKLSGLIQLDSISTVIKDAMELNISGMVNHHIDLKCDFANIEPFYLDRQKILQIIINLLANAKESFNTCVQDEKTINICTKESDDTVIVEIIDNGIGISAENMKSIFTHGFTTKEDGHGFGLHSAINAAQELGGQLSCSSDGSGCGATFRLELPKQISQAESVPKN